MQAPERFRKMYEGLAPERAIYAAMVTCMDEAIGQILERLRQNGLERDTLVFFASDNGATTEARGNYGGGSNGPFRGHKFSVFEGGIHMPGIVRWPTVASPDQTREQLACAIDLFATVAEAIGAALPADRAIDGRSWMPLLKDRNAPGHDALFWMQGGQRAVRRGKWKLVMSGNDYGPASRPAREGSQRRNASPVFLAELQNDPGETRNLREQYPQVVEELTGLHDRWRADVTASRARAPGR
jgi:arylsulfatase A-like enzyme